MASATLGKHQEADGGWSDRPDRDPEKAPNGRPPRLARLSPRETRRALTCCDETTIRFADFQVRAAPST
jgi:hypothetical protein